MEEAFQSYVRGWQPGISGQVQPEVTGSELMKRMKNLQGQGQDTCASRQRWRKNFQIRKGAGSAAHCNNHVANLEVMIKDLRHEIDELGRLATYLNGHRGPYIQVRRKLGAQVNRHSKGDKAQGLNYCFNTVKHQSAMAGFTPPAQDTQPDWQGF